MTVKTVEFERVIIGLRQAQRLPPKNYKRVVQ